MREDEAGGKEDMIGDGAVSTWLRQIEQFRKGLAAYQVGIRLVVNSTL